MEQPPMTRADALSRREHPTRREILKKAAALFCAGAAVSILGLPSSRGAATTGEGKVLIVYFSRSGNTRTMARMIQKAAGGDLLELETAASYPAAYKAVTEQAKKELEEGYLPPLKTKIPDLAAYDVVFVGSPSWWATLAPPVRTFLAGNDLSGKTVIPFVTHQGSGLGKSVVDLIRLCPNSTIRQALALSGPSVGLSRDAVNSWVRELGLAK